MSITNAVRVSVLGCSNLSDWQTVKYGNGRDHLRSSYTIYNVQVHVIFQCILITNYVIPTVIYISNYVLRTADTKCIIENTPEI